MNEFSLPRVHSKQENVLTHFFAVLSDEDVNYAVMRNAENLPVKSGRDLDLIVHPDHRQRLEAIVTEVVDDLDGWLLLYRRGSRRVHMNASWKDGTLICFDIQWDISFHKMVLSDAAPLLATAIVDPRGFKLLAPPYEATTSVINGLLGRSQVKEKYQKFAHQVFVTDANNLRKSFNHLISPALTDEILERCQSKDWSQLPELKTGVVNKLRWRFKSGVIEEIAARVHSYITRLVDLRSQCGPFVVLLGTHGAGKTTTAMALTERFTQAGFQTSYRHINSRPGILGSMTSNQAAASIAPPGSERAKYSALPHINEKTLTTAQRIKATGRLLYHALDYFVFHWRTVKPVLRRGEGVVCDRYLYDYLVEPRGVSGSPYWLRQFLCWLVPAPSLLVHLKANPEVIYARKVELPLEILGAQIEAFDALVTQHKGVSVSVDQPTSSVCREILAHLGPVQINRLP